MNAIPTCVLSRICSMLAEPFPEPSKDWARKLLDDQHATALQKRFAAEALLPRFGRNHERQPGEDWEEDNER